MARKVPLPRSRNRLQLPLDTHPPIRSTILCSLLTALLLLILSTLLPSWNSPVHFLTSSPTPIRPFTAVTDAQLLQIANTAVQKLLLEHCDRQHPNLHNDDLANIQTLVHIARIPLVFTMRLGVSGRRKLLTRLTRDTTGILTFQSIPRIAIIDVQNGLGNRLRALGSALEFAFYTRRILIVLWAPDPHLNTTMHNLFDPNALSNLILIEQPVAWPIDPNDRPHIHPEIPNTPDGHPSHTSFLHYNLMSKDHDFSSRQTPPVQNTPDKHVYIKSAYVIPSPWVSDQLSNAFIQALTPSRAVLTLVKTVEASAGGPNALAKMIGVHIRSRSIHDDNQAVDHQCEYSISGAAITDRWRKMSTPQHFIPEMRQMRKKWPSIVHQSTKLTSLTHIRVDTHDDDDDHHHHHHPDRHALSTIPINVSIPPRFFVSSDSRETLRELYKAFGENDIVTLGRACDDRGSACVLYAFADLILLSRTGAMLGSGWSSFSEAASRLRRRAEGVSPVHMDGYVYRLSGMDFGGPTRLQVVWRRVMVWMDGLARWGRVERLSQEERLRICKERRLGVKGL